MKVTLPVTKEFFIKRLTDLTLRSGLSGFPVDELAQQILLKSAVLSIDKSKTFTEKEINASLENWITNIVQLKGVDHITLRRMLVDAGYLARNSEGSSYRVVESSHKAELFSGEVEQVNISDAINNAREEIARRKREYQDRMK